MPRSTRLVGNTRLTGGDWSVFVTRPLSAFLLAIAVAVLVIVFLPAVKKKREEVFVEEN